MDYPTVHDQSEADAELLPEDVSTEAALSQQIPKLWLAHKTSKLETKRSKQELASARRTLATSLYEMKILLANTGRSGKWALFLRVNRIPRASADRLAKAHEESLKSAGANCLNEAISEETEDAVLRLVLKIHPQLWRTVSTEEAAYRFVAQVVDRLPYVDYRISDDAVTVYMPGKKPAA